MGGVLEDSFFVCTLKNYISPSDPSKNYDTHESGTSSSSTTLSLDIFCKIQKQTSYSEKTSEIKTNAIYDFHAFIMLSLVNAFERYICVYCATSLYDVTRVKCKSVVKNVSKTLRNLASWPMSTND